MNFLTVFANPLCELGEAPLWSNRRNSLFWLDILANRLYEKSFKSGLISEWNLPETVSSLAEDETGAEYLWLISKHCIAKFNLMISAYIPMVELPINAESRTNDGKVSPDGRYWFGTMLHEPLPEQGTVFSLGKDKTLRTEISGIAIPNTFCWMPDGTVLISDSLHQSCSRYKLDKDRTKIVSKIDFIDTSSSLGTPDGGALDDNGNVWIALWGAGKVSCFSPKGHLLSEIELPIPQPSSCCFGGPDNNLLFITSARQGLLVEQLEAYPDSGKTFVIKLKVKGAAINRFTMD